MPDKPKDFNIEKYYHPESYQGIERCNPGFFSEINQVEYQDDDRQI